MKEVLTQEVHNEKITGIMTKLTHDEDLTEEETAYFINILMSGGSNEYNCLISEYIIMLADALLNLNLHKKEMPITINDIYRFIKEAVAKQAEDEENVHVNNTIALLVLGLYDAVIEEFAKFKEKNEELLKTINDRCVESKLKEEDAIKLTDLTNNIFTRVKEELVENNPEENIEEK